MTFQKISKVALLPANPSKNMNKYEYTEIAIFIQMMSIRLKMNVKS